MQRRKSQTPYRIVGGRGRWFAWNASRRLDAWPPHVVDIKLTAGKRVGGVRAVRGRTPFEALERLKRLEARAC